VSSNITHGDFTELLHKPDDELVQLSKEGNLQAAEVLLQRYKNLVLAKSRAYFLIGAEPDDIIQEGMIGLYKAIRSYSPEKSPSFRMFAEICIVRQILSAIKAANRHKHQPLNSYVSLNKPIYVDGAEKDLMDFLSKEQISNPEEIYLLNEKFDEIQKKASQRLSPFERSVLQLYLEGLSYHEIADALQKPVKSVDNAIQRIKKKLIEIMQL
jgi:RNA polymerase sporulation-specific sigma factor